MMKFYFLIIGLMLILFTAIPSKSQVKCSGSQLFIEKNCAGDEISKDELQLVTLINQYRKENGLTEIPISKPLSIVANRHLIDLELNLKTLSHGWSNCPYDIKNKETWNCVTEAPKRLKVDFQGDGFENLYRNLNGNAAPAPALEGWKKSPLHNSLILNLKNWNQRKWESIGVSIRGQYAAIWFGSNASDNALEDYKQQKGLGLSFQDVVKNLTNVVSIQQTSTVLENNKWIGSSKDKNIILELHGTVKDISEAALSLKIKLDPQKNLSQRNKNLVLVYLNNIYSNTAEAEKWFDANYLKIQQNPNSTQIFIKDGKVLELRIDKNNFLVINAKPYKNTNAGAREIN